MTNAPAAAARAAVTPSSRTRAEREIWSTKEFASPISNTLQSLATARTKPAQSFAWTGKCRWQAATRSRALITLVPRHLNGAIGPIHCMGTEAVRATGQCHRHATITDV